LACLLVTRAESVLQCRSSVSESAIAAYWSYSKCRNNRWAQALKAYSQACHEETEQVLYARNLRPLLEEILASEILTRVWTPLIVHWDSQRLHELYAPAVQNVFVCHAESRHRALQLVMHGNGASFADAANLNLLLRRIEHWTDVLVGGLLPYCDAKPFAFDARRAESYAVEVASPLRDCSGARRWHTMCASLKAAFNGYMHDDAPNADLNQAIADSILSCLDPSWLENIDAMKSIWVERMTGTASQAEMLLRDIWLDASFQHLRHLPPRHRHDSAERRPRPPRF
jgi:hypothetical protein